MNQEPLSLVLKYCEMLDQFVRIRVFGPDDSPRLVGADGIANKRSYQRLVNEACILSFDEQIRPRLEPAGATGDRESPEEFLYHLCVEVNPHLEIHNVALPLAPVLPEAAPAPLAAPLPLRRNLDAVRDLEARLRERVVGQEEAVRAVTRAVHKAELGLQDPERPIGAFLFVGQTGVGKTELAKALAACWRGDVERMIRIDCSEYGQPHEYAKLIGAPPGYVGHQDGGLLTDPIRAMGAAVVLFDEIEKAHPVVHNLLLQMLDEGFITDSRGRRVDFRDSIILLTSNVGCREVAALGHGIGFGEAPDREPSHGDARAETLRALEGAFAPEFLNRLDDVLLFRPLSVEHGTEIVQGALERLAERVARVPVRLRLDAGAARRIAECGMSRRYGARELLRTLAATVENPLTEMILDGRVAAGSEVTVTVRQGDVRLVAA